MAGAAPGGGGVVARSRDPLSRVMVCGDGPGGTAAGAVGGRCRAASLRAGCDAVGELLVTASGDATGGVRVRAVAGGVWVVFVVAVG